MCQDFIAAQKDVNDLKKIIFFSEHLASLFSKHQANQAVQYHSLQFNCRENTMGVLYLH